ncbi:AzlD domain-containing protein [Pelosinus sp. UFO1]|uniref:AzlD domain-containing protein n=1 Tax=Pelosinus sp. UFO1 TaxID=484770 RepID=UPI0004D1C757|nr:AzlD domain-containing protein [Pelosinus sp. UFO1]AIF49966.1 branched-chain amino acid transport [Pelosinus sp. UFO1]
MRIEFFMNILAMAIATFATRFVSIGLLGSSGVPAWFGRFLKHVPTAMLTALIAPAIFAPRGYIELTFANHYLMAGAVAIFVAYKRQPPIATMGAGIAVMLALRIM